MKCNKCPYAEKVHGVVNYYTCSQRGGSRHGHDGCELIEAIKARNKVKVNNLLHPPQPVDFEEDTVEMEPVGNPHWPYDAEMLPETIEYYSYEEMDQILDEMILELENGTLTSW